MVLSLGNFKLLKFNFFHKGVEGRGIFSVSDLFAFDIFVS